MGILEFFKKIVGKGEDKENGNGHEGDLQLSCVDCSKTFTFEAGEQKFFKARGLTPPKRCGSCRSKKKRRR